jgi:glycosyltransferase involved in cell wall biosynthesis
LGTTFKKIKVAWICSIDIGPYYFYMFNSLLELHRDFFVVRVKDSKSQPRHWPESFKSVNWKEYIVANNKNIWKILNNESPNVIIIAGNSKAYIYAILWAKLHKVPCVLASDTPYPRLSRLKVKEKVKNFLLKKLFSGAFVPGEKAFNYRISQGFPPTRIWKGLCVSNNTHFNSSSGNWTPPPDFPQKFFLTVCRLSPEKNVSTLLKAFEEYRKKGGSWGLVIVGTGPEEKKLKSLVPLDLKKVIYFAGYVGYNDLPSVYHKASCFVLPSIWEAWGVVVNEAMAAGLPLLISKRCGCLPDLCFEGVNGFSFDPFKFEELAELMFKISSNQIDIKSFGEASKKIISKYTCEKWAQTVMEICTTLLNFQKP